MLALVDGGAEALFGAFAYEWNRSLPTPLFVIGWLGVFESASDRGLDNPTCEAGGVAAFLGLIVANPDEGGALIEANPDDVVVGGGRVS